MGCLPVISIPPVAIAPYPGTRRRLDLLLVGRRHPILRRRRRLDEGGPGDTLDPVEVAGNLLEYSSFVTGRCPRANAGHGTGNADLIIRPAITPQQWSAAVANSGNQ